jgi:hypothetical protein
MLGAPFERQTIPLPNQAMTPSQSAARSEMLFGVAKRRGKLANQVTKNLWTGIARRSPQITRPFFVKQSPPDISAARREMQVEPAANV